MHRRTYLQLGLAGLAGGSFLDLLALRQSSASEGTNTKPKSNCILIWMDGGPTHLETFDLKPEAPAEIRGEFRPIETNVSGMRICEYMPKLAKIADKYSIIRSVCHNQANHGAGNQHQQSHHAKDDFDQSGFGLFDRFFVGRCCCLFCHGLTFCGSIRWWARPSGQKVHVAARHAGPGAQALGGGGALLAGSASALRLSLAPRCRVSARLAL